jgi:hypothetical protein
MARWASSFRVSFTPVTARMRFLRTASLMADLDGSTKDYVEELVEVWQSDENKPAPFIGQDYIRTHRMQDSWRIVSKSTSARISYTYANYVTDRRGKYYARIVHGFRNAPEEQAPIHQGRWKTIDDAYEEVGSHEEFRQRTQGMINKSMGVR